MAVHKINIQKYIVFYRLGKIMTFEKWCIFQQNQKVTVKNNSKKLYIQSQLGNKILLKGLKED